MRRRIKSTGEDFERQQSSIWYVPSAPDEAERRFFARQQQFYVSMFTQDLPLHVMPSSLNRDESSTRLTIEPDDQKIGSLLARAFAVSQDRGYHDFEYPFSEFIRLLTSELCSYSEVTFEVARLFAAGAKNPSGFELVHLNPSQLRRRRGETYQCVPPEVARERGVSESIPLPRENLVVFTLPSPIRKKIGRSMEAFTVLSDRRWSEMSMASLGGKLPYDFSHHNRSQMLALAEACRITGWSARGTFHQKALPTYWLGMNIEFERFALHVREALVSQVNTMLQRLGPRFGFAARITLDGFLTEADLAGALKLIDEGKTPFTEIFDLISQSRRRTPKQEPVGAPQGELPAGGVDGLKQ